MMVLRLAPLKPSLWFWTTNKIKKNIENDSGGHSQFFALLRCYEKLKWKNELMKKRKKCITTVKKEKKFPVTKRKEN